MAAKATIFVVSIIFLLRVFYNFKLPLIVLKVGCIKFYKCIQLNVIRSFFFIFLSFPKILTIFERDLYTLSLKSFAFLKVSILQSSSNYFEVYTQFTNLPFRDTWLSRRNTSRLILESKIQLLKFLTKVTLLLKIRGPCNRLLFLTQAPVTHNYTSVNFNEIHQLNGNDVDALLFIKSS